MTVVAVGQPDGTRFAVSDEGQRRSPLAKAARAVYRKRMDRFDELKTDLSRIESDIASFKTAVDKRSNLVDKRFAAIDKRFDEIDKRFDKVDDRFDAMDDKFVKLEQRLMQYIADVAMHTAQVVSDQVERRLGEQLERHARSAADDFRSFMATIDDKYKHLPSAFDALRGDLDAHVADDDRHRSST